MNHVRSAFLVGVVSLGVVAAQSDGTTTPNPAHPQLPEAGKVVPHDHLMPAADNRSGVPLKIHETVLLFPRASCVQVEMTDVVLPAGSFVELRSLADGDTERLTGDRVSDGVLHSAYFNGDSLQVRLFAGPRTKGTTARIKTVAVGHPIPPGAPNTICGNTDDRVASTDKRVARLILRAGSNFTWCSGFLISNTDCFATAGHCLAVSGLSLVTAQFNVPASNANGSLVNPSASDQYLWETATSSRIFKSGGVGDDWGVSRKYARNVTPSGPASKRVMPTASGS